MQSEKITSKKISDNQALVTRVQTFLVNVKAEKPENAFRRLRARNRADLSSDVPKGAKLLFSTWVDPKEKDGAWIVRGDELPKDPTGKTILAWDGEKLIKQSLPEGMTEAVLFGD